MKLLLATRNAAKVAEYRLLFTGLPLQLTTPEEEGLEVEMAEKGATMEENAISKATTCALASGLVTVADDSGLEVEALGGEPGVRSARYAGPGVSNGERIAYLLRKMEGVPWPKRRARFRCVIAIASDRGTLELCSGQCRGLIAFQPKGGHGFGYDPVFYLPKLGMTMAELPMEEKNKVSHRAKAAAKARRILAQLFGGDGL